MHGTTSITLEWVQTQSQQLRNECKHNMENNKGNTTKKIYFIRDGWHNLSNFGMGPNSIEDNELPSMNL